MYQYIPVGWDRIRIMEGIDQTFMDFGDVDETPGEPACAGNKAFFTAQLGK